MIITVTILLVLATVFLAWPLWRLSKTSVADDSEDQNFSVKQLHDDRLQELAAAHKDETGDALKRETNALLVLEHQQAQALAKVHKAASYRYVSLPVKLALLLLGPGLGFAVYSYVADPNAVELMGAEAVMHMSADQQRSDIEAWRDLLQRRVGQKSDDAKSWYLLGHAHLKLNNFQAAAESFASTNSLTPDDLTVQIYWLQSRFLADKGKLDQFGLELAQSLLTTNPNLPVVLEVLAMHEFQQGNKLAAISYLNRAITAARDVSQQMGWAKAISNIRSTLEAVPLGVEVKVSVQTEAQSLLPQNSTLFVLARPVGGGMPYAVVRRPAILLPTSLYLDDLVSMSPQRQLSSADEFEVVVRISRSGSAMPAATDWQYVSPPLDKASLPQTVVAELSPPT